MTSTKRSTCWSITINNPTKEEVDAWTSIPGWKLVGQYEEGGKTGTPHFQGMLTTPQVRCSAVKRVFPRAHIEIARDKGALAVYVNKEDTRVATYEATGVPSLFEYHDKIASLWNESEWNRRRLDDLYCKRYKWDFGDMALGYVDDLVALEIEKGQRGIEFIAINPMWRSAWKKFYHSIITRYARSSQVEPPPSPPSPSHDSSSDNEGNSIQSSASLHGDC